MTQLAAVVGLPIERLILTMRCASVFARPAEQWIAVAHADSVRAEALADDLIDRGAEVLLSFGVAGGLDPSLKAGSFVLASEVALPGGDRIATDGVWRKAVQSRLNGFSVSERPLAGSDRPVADAGEKAALLARTGAAAVDMESHGVARAAARRSVPLVVMRAIADPARRAIPSSAMAGLANDGEIRPLATLARLFAAPGELPALAGLAADTARALATLWQVAAGLKDGAWH
ncbi:MAG TPA: hypothetical protein VMU42_19890 [Candidatus Sulfotelmatobacter sp.]|nr:hypothetical protein [Candidatus Sulfotelmatobacter sp.]